MTDYTGQQWGSYRLVRLLGSGGFADVYLGEHIHLGTQAALKILTTKLASEEMSRFRDEARTIMQLEHPHIVRVLDFGLENRIPFIVMSYAPGGSLRQQHPQGKTLPPSLVTNYVKQIASALQHAHNQKLIHRDVKPDNMLIRKNGELLLSDFGIVAIAHSTRTLNTQDASGTIYYMAPEQSLGKPRPASDQYALGVAVYEWLTGTFPFTGTAMEVAMQHLVAPPPPLREKIPTISPEVEQVVLRALAKKPEERFPDVMAFATALEQAEKPDKIATAIPQEMRKMMAAFEQAEKPDKIATAPSPAPRAASPITFTVLSGAGDLKWISGELYYAVGYGDGLIQVWQCATNQLVSTCYGHTNRVVGVAWSPDGSRLASTSYDGTVRIWKAMTGQSLTVTSRPGATSYREVAWSSDGTRLVVNSYGKYKEAHQIIDILDANTGSSITFFELKDYVLQLRWFPDGTRITFTDGDKKLQIIEAATGRLLTSYKLPNYDAVVYSPDCRYLAMVVEETTHIEIREVATSSVIISYDVSGIAEDLQWSPDSRHLAFAIKEAIQVREAHTGRLVTSYTGHKDQVGSITWHPFNTRIASSSDDKTIQVWEAMNGRHLATHSIQGSKYIAVDWTPDGTQLISYSGRATVQVLKRATGQVSSIYQGHDSEIFTVAWSPDGTKIASGSTDKTVQVWHAQTGHCLATYTHSDIANTIAWSPDSQQIASRCVGSQEVHVWHAKTGRHLVTYIAREFSGIHAVAWSPNGRFLATLSEGISESIVEIWEVTTKQIVTSYTPIDYQRFDNSIAWSPDSMQIASSAASFVIWSPDGRYIASRRTVEIHEVLPENIIAYYEHPGASLRVWDTTTDSSHILCGDFVDSAAWSPDGNYIAAGHSGGTVRIREIATRRPITTYRGYQDRGGVTWSPDGNYLAYTAFSTEIQTYPGAS